MEKEGKDALEMGKEEAQENKEGSEEESRRAVVLSAALSCAVWEPGEAVHIIWNNVCSAASGSRKVLSNLRIR